MGLPVISPRKDPASTKKPMSTPRHPENHPSSATVHPTKRGFKHSWSPTSRWRTWDSSHINIWAAKISSTWPASVNLDLTEKKGDREWRIHINVLIVAAHPDDEVLGCGGTAAGLSAHSDVHIGILGEGITARYPSPESAPQNELDRLTAEAKSAAKVLGASDVVFGGLPDNRFDSLPLLDIVKTVEGWVDRYKPEIIYTHHPGDLNVDHGLTYRAVLTATRPTEGTSVREIYSFEVASSTEWAFQSIEPVFRPNTFVDITATIDRKIQALQAYKSEVRPFPHPRSPETLRSMARRWGSVSGTEYAEAFELVRSIRR